MTIATQPLIAVFTIALLTISGGLWIATRKPSWYSENKLQAFLAVGAGLLLCIAFMEFLPVAFKENEHAPILIIAGLLFVIFMETYVAPKFSFLEEKNSCGHDHSHDHHHHDHSHSHNHIVPHQAACSAIGCLIVCSFFDGIQLNAAFLLGSETGWIVSLGLLFHILPDGVLAATIAIAGGLKKKSVLTVAWLPGITMVMGYLFAAMVDAWTGELSIVLPFASGVLLYVTLIHLLPAGLRHRFGLVLVAIGAIAFTTIHHLSGHVH